MQSHSATHGQHPLRGGHNAALSDELQGNNQLIGRHRPHERRPRSCRMQRRGQVRHTGVVLKDTRHEKRQQKQPGQSVRQGDGGGGQTPGPTYSHHQPKHRNTSASHKKHDQQHPQRHDRACLGQEVEATVERQANVEAQHQRQYNDVHEGGFGTEEERPRGRLGGVLGTQAARKRCTSKHTTPGNRQYAVIAWVLSRI